MFIDTVELDLIAGDGGDGAVAFRREKYEPSGGPAGGDGGDGGSILVFADKNIRTLMDYQYKNTYKAQNGEPGRGKKQFGKKGEDLVLKVPVGTLIKDTASQKVIRDMVEDGEQFIIAKGGRGGRGNAKFATAVRQAPRFSERGKKGENRRITLEIKLLADVGLVGFPNVGKSSILSIISDAKPKIANYHFTTLEPNLGVVKIDVEKSYIVADIPGLIEKASEGVGLGHEFLRHIERTGLLVHVLDMSGMEGRDPLEDFEKINRELQNYNEKLLDKQQIVVANKMDIPGSDENLQRFRKKYQEQYQIYETIAATGQGIKELRYGLWNMLEAVGFKYDTFDEVYDYYDEVPQEDEPLSVAVEDQIYYVQGSVAERLVQKINFEDYDSLMYFQRKLNELGITAVLKEAEIPDGATVDIDGYQFEYYE